MKLNLTKEQESKTKEILRAMASSNREESWKAQEILAAFVGPTIAQVLDQLATSDLVYKKFSYDRGTDPSIPLDLFEGNIEGLITVWSQTIAGGLATNHVSGMDEFRFTVDTLNSAVSCLKKYAENARLDVVNAMINKMVQEILVKSEYLNWGTLLAALANSRSNPTGLAQVYDGDGSHVFKLADVNTLWTKVKRLRSSWVGGTPTSKPGKGLTHLIVSPEVEGDIRAFVYNPQNTAAYPDNTESTALGLPDAIREQVFNAAGLSSLWGVQIVVLNEMGVGQPYSYLFDDYYTNAGSEPAFDIANDELVIGVDASIAGLIKIEESDADTGSTVMVEPDDQWSKRSGKIGFYAERKEGRIVVDSKCLAAIIV